MRYDGIPKGPQSKEMGGPQHGRVGWRQTSHSQATSPDSWTQHQPSTETATHLFQARHSATAVSAGTEGGFHILLDEGEVVACSQLVLQKQGGAHTAELPMGNDGNPVPQDVRFIHVVCGENDGAACRAQTQGRGTGETCRFSLTAAARIKKYEQGQAWKKDLEACVAVTSRMAKLSV